MDRQLLGAPEVATQWFLHTTGLYCTTYGTDHSITRASARRTVQAWCAIDDPERAPALADEVLAMLAYLNSEEINVLAQQVTTRLPAVCVVEGVGDQPAPLRRR